MALSDLNVSLALVTKNFDKELNKVQRRLNRFSRELANIGSTISTAVTAPIVALGAASTKIFADFEQEIAKVSAVSGATETQFEALRDSALELGRTTQFTASQVASLQLNLSKLGFNPEEINAATAGILDLALATGEDLAQSATVAAGTLRGFELAATEITRVTDVMAKSFSSTGLDLEKFEVAMRSVAPVANVAGASLEQTTAILGTLINRNVDASTAGTALRNIFLRLAKEGLSWNDAIEKITKSTNPLNTANELFGERGAAVATIIANNVDEISNLTGVFVDAEGAARGMASIMENTLQGSFLRLTSAVEGAAISFGSILAPTIRAIADRLNAAVTGFNSLNPELKKAIVNVAAVAAAIGPAIFAIGKLISVGAFAIQTMRTLTGVFASSVAGLVHVATGFAALRKSVQASIVAFKALDLATKATIIGGVAVVVTGLVLAFDKLNDTLSDGVKIQRTLNSVQADAKKTIAEETAAVDPLIAVLEDETIARGQKEAALKRLQQISPKYFGGLKIEGEEITGLTKAHEGYNKALQETARFQAANAKLREIQAEVIDLEIKKTEQLTAAQNARGFLSDSLEATALRRAKNIQKEIDLARKKSEAVFEIIKKTDFSLIDDSPTIRPTVTTDDLNGDDLSGVIASNLTTTVTVDTEQAETAASRLQSAFTGPFGFINNAIDKAARGFRLFGADQKEVIEQASEITPAFTGPLGFINNAINKAATGYKLFGATVAEETEKINEGNKRLSETISSIGSQLGLVFEEGKGFFVDFKDIGIDALGGIIDAFGDSLVGFRSFGQELGKILKSVLARILKAVAAAAAFAAIISLIPGLGGALGIANVAKGFGGNFLNLLKGGFTPFASGGIVTRPTLGLVGEAGDEAIIPLEKLNDFGFGGGTLDARISGRDLLLLIDRERAAQNRSRGG